jgi:peroxiredoxin
MTISVGDKIPVVDLNIMTDNGPRTLSTNEIFAGKRVALFGLPGAFTRTCSARHLPGFIDNADTLKAKGISTIACIAVNDIFVMNAWGKAQGAGTHIMMLADGSAKFAQATDLDVNMSDKGFGIRCMRFSMIVDNCVIKNLNIDSPGTFEVSSAEVMLGEL